MKRVGLFLLMMVMAVSVFAKGEAEPNEPVTVTYLSNGIEVLPGVRAIDWVRDRIVAEFPNAVLEDALVDLSDGSPFTVKAMIAAGMAPNIYDDTLLRSSSYMVPEYALPLDGYIRDLDKYPESTLAPYRRNGDLLGLPRGGAGQGMAINLDIMDEIGFTPEWDWTIADFLEMAELVKQKYKGEKWATGMFAANQSGDYLINNWFAAFGAEFYQNGDYSHTTIRETGGAKVHEFFQLLVDKEYVPPGAATLNDDDYAAAWAEGKYAATAFFPHWAGIYFPTAIDQGKIEKPFRYMFIPFPRAEGVEKVPTYFMNGAFVVHKTGTIADQIAARMVEYINSEEMQRTLATVASQIPSRSDVVVEMDPYTTMVMRIVQKEGVFDVGLTCPQYSVTRPQHYPILQRVLNKQVTPDKSILEYELALNAALKP